MTKCTSNSCLYQSINVRQVWGTVFQEVASWQESRKGGQTIPVHTELSRTDELSWPVSQRHLQTDLEMTKQGSTGGLRDGKEPHMVMITPPGWQGHQQDGVDLGSPGGEKGAAQRTSSSSQKSRGHVRVFMEQLIYSASRSFATLNLLKVKG